MATYELDTTFDVTQFPRALAAVAVFNAHNPGAQLCADIEHGRYALYTELVGVRAYRDHAEEVCAAVERGETPTARNVEDPRPQLREEILRAIGSWFAAQGVQNCERNQETGRFEFSISGTPVDFGATEGGEVLVVATGTTTGEAGVVVHACNASNLRDHSATAFPVHNAETWWPVVHRVAAVQGASEDEYDATLRAAVQAVLQHLHEVEALVRAG